MKPGREAQVIIDRSVTILDRPLTELQALMAKAVALLAGHGQAVSATIFRRPRSGAYWISLNGPAKQSLGLYQLNRQSCTVDFEVQPVRPVGPV